MTWFLARLGEIIEDFPLTVPVEVDEAHQCISRLSRCEEMQIWSRGHVPLGVWFSVIHAFLILFAGLWDMWSPSRSWTFLLDSEDCSSELKSDRLFKRKQRQAELIMCEVWRWFKSPCLVTLVALEANQSLVAMWCRIITASQQSCYSVGRGMDMRGWTPSLGDTLCCARFHTCFHALKRKIYDILVILLSPEFSRIFKTHVLMFFSWRPLFWHWGC